MLVMSKIGQGPDTFATAITSLNSKYSPELDKESKIVVLLRTAGYQYGTTHISKQKFLKSKDVAVTCDKSFWQCTNFDV